MALSVGNPHMVFFVPDETAIEIDRLGPSIEHDPAFPERINVNVASVRDDGIHLLTWERGAGLTLACGTGACATAVAAIVQKKVRLPGQGPYARRRADHQLGRRANRSECRAPRRTCSRARSSWSSSLDSCPDDHAGLPPQLRRKRGDARAGRRRHDHRQQLRGHQRSCPPDPPGHPTRASRGAGQADHRDGMRGPTRSGGIRRDAGGEPGGRQCGKISGAFANSRSCRAKSRHPSLDFARDERTLCGSAGQ